MKYKKQESIESKSGSFQNCLNWAWGVCVNRVAVYMSDDHTDMTN